MSARSVRASRGSQCAYCHDCGRQPGAQRSTPWMMKPATPSSPPSATASAAGWARRMRRCSRRNPARSANSASSARRSCSSRSRRLDASSASALPPVRSTIGSTTRGAANLTTAVSAASTPPNPAAKITYGVVCGRYRASVKSDVMVVGTLYAGLRLDGVVSGRVRRDGANATRVLAALSRGSRFGAHLHAILLQGIALAGFNVVDLAALHTLTRLPVLVVARRRPDLDAIRRALLQRVPGGRRKWTLIERAGPMEPLRGVFVQRAGMERAEAEALLAATTTQGKLPEPLRVAHLVAGGLGSGASRGRG